MRTRLLLLAAALTLPSSTFAQSPWSQTVREVEPPHRAPYIAQDALAFGFKCANCDDGQFAAPPANKRLVVEHVAVSYTTPTNGAWHCSIGRMGGIWMPLEAPRRAGSQMIVSQQIRMYFDATPHIQCSRTESSNIQWIGLAVLSGYLVDKPTN